MRQTGLAQALLPRRPPIRVGVDDQLGAAAQRRVAGRVHVAEDHVGLQPRLQDPVGAAVDGDDQRPHVADVGAQGLQVAAVALAADDDQHVAVAEGGPGRREGDVAGEQVGLFAHVGDGVLGEFPERLVDPLSVLLHLALELGDAEGPAAGDLLPVDEDRLADDTDAVAVPMRSNRFASGASISLIPARASISGPAFG